MNTQNNFITCDVQAVKQGGEKVSDNAEPAVDDATDHASGQGKGLADIIHKTNKVRDASSQQPCILAVNQGPQTITST